MADTLPRTHSCFVCGVANPTGLNLEFTAEDQRVVTRFCPRPEHVGFQHTVHGGLLAAVLDEVMVWACGVATGKFSYCAELTVRYVQPVRPGEMLLAVGELTANRRDRLYEARGELRDEQGQVRATATGKYLPIPAATAQGMLEDFVGKPTRIFPVRPSTGSEPSGSR